LCGPCHIDEMRAKHIGEEQRANGENHRAAGPAAAWPAVVHACCQRKQCLLGPVPAVYTACFTQPLWSVVCCGPLYLAKTSPQNVVRCDYRPTGVRISLVYGTIARNTNFFRE
jgi:hypothetical protein